MYLTYSNRKIRPIEFTDELDLSILHKVETHEVYAYSNRPVSWTKKYVLCLMIIVVMKAILIWHPYRFLWDLHTTLLHQQLLHYITKLLGWSILAIINFPLLNYGTSEITSKHLKHG